jgi:hypothetical protein
MPESHQIHHNRQLHCDWLADGPMTVMRAGINASFAGDEPGLCLRMARFRIGLTAPQLLRI